MNNLTDSIQYLKGVGPERAKVLNRLGISAIRDLLYYFPRTYLDRSHIRTIREIADLRPAEEIIISGQVLTTSAYRTKRGMQMLEVAVSDDTGIITAIWFNQPFLKQVFSKGQKVILAGKLASYGRTLQISSPEYEIIPERPIAVDEATGFTPIHSGGIVPCYSLTESLGQKFLRRLMKATVPVYAPQAPDIIDKQLTLKHHLMPLADALKEIHFPSSQDAVISARRRIAYEELYLLQIALGLKRNQVHKTLIKHPIKISGFLDSRIRARIPFTLTKAQERVINELKRDLQVPWPMRRLLQGDVGSGKTIIAVYGILAAIGNKLQSAFMAPTEILAEQHYRTLTQILANSQVRIAFLRSGLPRLERLKTIDAIKSGNIDLVIGTHALIQKDIAFHKLGLVIIDEQHKFGVVQRDTLSSKGQPVPSSGTNRGQTPHLLVMTATPIPRTLALTVFGDLDVSVIDELPPGRQPVKTILRPAAKMPEALEFIRNKIKEGRQVYFVYPLIDDSDKTPLKSATQMAKQLREIFPEYQVALLHGKKTDRHKEKIMSQFRAGKVQILVSTIVIEVGIDVSNASIMVIEHAERYGLAQLHQLRGRIGRGAHKSYCLLFGNYTTPEAESRLRIMEATNDGFRIAEEDLKIRGPGEFLGTKQSGIPEFRVADITKDMELLNHTRTDAQETLARDPLLQQTAHHQLLQAIKQFGWMKEV